MRLLVLLGGISTERARNILRQHLGMHEKALSARYLSRNSFSNAYTLVKLFVLLNRTVRTKESYSRDTGKAANRPPNRRFSARCPTTGKKRTRQCETCHWTFHKWNQPNVYVGH